MTSILQAQSYILHDLALVASLKRNMKESGIGYERKLEAMLL